MDQPDTETVVCYCTRCNYELARFKNSWKAIGKTYFAPNYPLLSSFHGFLKHGEPAQAADNSPVANCYTQDVICDSCKSGSMGLQCVNAPANHILKRDQFLLRLKNITLLSESTGLPVEPFVEQSVLLNPEDRSKSSSGNQASTIKPKDSIRSMHLPSEGPGHVSQAQANPMVAAPIPSLDPNYILKFTRWAQNSIVSQRQDMARVLSAMDTIQAEMSMFRSFITEVRNEQKESERFRSTYERAVGKVNADLKTLSYKVDSIGKKEEARGISGQSLSRDIEIIVSDLRKLYEDISQVGEVKIAISGIAKKIVALEQKVDQSATKETATQASRRNDPVDNLQQEKTMGDWNRQLQALHNRISIVEPIVQVISSVAKAREAPVNDSQVLGRVAPAQWERSAPANTSTFPISKTTIHTAQQKSLDQVHKSTVSTPENKTHSQEAATRTREDITQIQEARMPVPRTYPRVVIPLMRSKEPRQQRSRLDTGNAISESSSQHNQTAEKQPERPDNSLKRKQAHMDAQSSLDQNDDDDQLALSRKRGHPRRNLGTIEKPKPAPRSFTPERLLSPTPDIEIIEISASPTPAPAKERLLTPAQHTGLRSGIVQDSVSDSSEGLEQGQIDIRNNESHTNTTKKVPLQEDPPATHNHTPTNTTMLRNDNRSRRLSLRRTGSSGDLNGSTQDQDTPECLELGRIRAANGVLLTTTGELDGRSLRNRIIPNGGTPLQLPKSRGNSGRAKRRASMPANAILPLTELREHASESRTFSPALVPFGKTAENKKYKCPVCSATYDYAGGLSYHKRNSACYVDGVENPEGAREAMLVGREKLVKEILEREMAKRRDEY